MTQSPCPQKLRACLHFLLRDGLPVADRLALARHIDSPEQALFTSPPAGMPVSLSAWQRWITSPDTLTDALSRTLDWLTGGCPDSPRSAISFWDAAYPAALRQQPRPPWLLLVEGQLPDPGKPVLAMVGSRNPSHSGLRRAREFAAALSSAGWVIASGMARGIDGAAHSGALDSGGPTIAVLGCGIDQIYPPEHGRLHRAIVRGGGAVVSEYPPGTPPNAGFFPARNRIIAGWSKGVLVVEAAIRSGSLITAHQANEMGRAVMAIPGSIDSPMSRGCHQMIRAGARLVETIDDILDEMGCTPPASRPHRDRRPALSLKNRSAPVAPQQQTLPVALPGQQTAPDALLTAQQASLLKLFGHEPLQFDTLVDQSKLSAATVAGLLIELEIEGRLESRPGHWWHPV